ncbi:hypothetical protein GHT06_008754 [Daphnia sinensis]|uniref:C1q domain-containing protein n=1 Tax=Daphnia sinensis TaxID=1820382 RepID=A0AAD5L4V4_9CRUS|nr:hypothetical protein GHT06_008754 [Daphnia sinensis]
MLRDLGATFTKTGNGKGFEEKIDPVVLKQNTELKMDCYNNLCACLLKNEKPDYEKVVFYCREVLKCSRENPKTHFRMAIALFELGDFNAALEACNEALRWGPSQGFFLRKPKLAYTYVIQAQMKKNKSSKLSGLRDLLFSYSFIFSVLVWIIIAAITHQTSPTSPTISTDLSNATTCEASNATSVSCNRLHRLTQTDNVATEHKVAEMMKAIEKATEELNALNQTLQIVYDYKVKLAGMESSLNTKYLLDLINLNKVDREIQRMGMMDEEVTMKYNRMLALQTRAERLRTTLENNANLDDQRQQHQSMLDSQHISFFAQRTTSYSQRNNINNYQINYLNQGGAFNKTSGIFTVPVNGLYYFSFNALKTKQSLSGTSRLTVQIAQISPTLRILAKTHIDSSDWNGWYSVQVKAIADLVVNDRIAVQILEGSIYESGILGHVTTSFGGYLIFRL